MAPPIGGPCRLPQNPTTWRDAYAADGGLREVDIVNPERESLAEGLARLARGGVVVVIYAVGGLLTGQAVGGLARRGRMVVRWANDSPFLKQAAHLLSEARIVVDREATERHDECSISNAAAFPAPVVLGPRR